MTPDHRPTVLGALPANPPGTAWSPQSGPQAHGAGAGHLRQWLVGRRNDGATPADVARELVAAGWDADAAATTAMGSLRRADRNALLWFALCWSAGLAAVGFTTGVHQLLSVHPNRALAATGLTLALALAPVAVVLGTVASRVEARSRFAMWSPERRGWFATLAGCTAVVGLLRLLTYLYMAVASVVGARPAPLEVRDLAQVAVTLTVAVPLFVWSYRQWRRSDLVISGLHPHEENDEPAQQQ